MAGWRRSPPNFPPSDHEHPWVLMITWRGRGPPPGPSGRGDCPGPCPGSARRACGGTGARGRGRRAPRRPQSCGQGMADRGKMCADLVGAASLEARAHERVVAGGALDLEVGAGARLCVRCWTSACRRRGPAGRVGPGAAPSAGGAGQVAPAATQRLRSAPALRGSPSATSVNRTCRGPGGGRFRCGSRRCPARKPLDQRSAAWCRGCAASSAACRSRRRSPSQTITGSTGRAGHQLLGGLRNLQHARHLRRRPPWIRGFRPPRTLPASTLRRPCATPFAACRREPGVEAPCPSAAGRAAHAGAWASPLWMEDGEHEPRSRRCPRC